MSQERSALDARAISVMVLLTALWGFQQVTIKLIAADVSLVMQAGIRSIVATILVSHLRRDGTCCSTRQALFAASSRSTRLGHTNASRMSVFVYLAPPLTALGLHFFVAGERLGALQWSGVLVAFAGLVLAFRGSFG